jgi:hypothetical protein
VVGRQQQLGRQTRRRPASTAVAAHREGGGGDWGSRPPCRPVKTPMHAGRACAAHCKHIAFSIPQKHASFRHRWAPGQPPPPFLAQVAADQAAHAGEGIRHGLHGSTQPVKHGLAGGSAAWVPVGGRASARDDDAISQPAWPGSIVAKGTSSSSGGGGGGSPQCRSRP